MCKPLINYVCSVILEQLEKKKMFFLGATPNLANVRRSDGKSNLLGQERSDGRATAQKTRFCVRSPIGDGAKREMEAGNGS